MNTSNHTECSPEIKSAAHDNIVGINVHSSTLGLLDTFSRKAKQLQSLLHYLDVDNNHHGLWLAGDLVTLLQQLFDELEKRHQCLLEGIEHDRRAAREEQSQ